MNRSHLSAYLIIGACFVLTQFSLGLYLPALPDLTLYFQASTREMLLSLSVITAGYAIGQLLWGRLSDRIGRRPVYIVSLLLYLFTTLLLLNTTTLSFFYLNMALLGFCAATFTCVGNAFLLDILGKKEAQVGIAYIGIAMATATTITPPIAAQLLMWFEWPSIFLALMIYSGLILIGIFFLLPETHHFREKESQNVMKVYIKLFFHPQYMGYLIILGGCFGVLMTYLASAPIIYESIFHSTHHEYGYLFLLSGFAIILGSVITRLRIRQWGPDKLIARGLMCALLGSLGTILIHLNHASNPYTLSVPIGFFLLGISITIPATKAGAMILFENNRGTVAAMMKFTQIALTTIITALAALLLITKNIALMGGYFLLINLTAYFCLRFMVLRPPHT